MNIIIGSDFMKLIVGLGNPGKEYENTRHNVGFSFIDFYLESKDLSVTWQKKFDGLFYQTEVDGEKVFFLKPQTYMNLSGNCVSKFVNFYNIDISDILVIYDDYNFEVGTFRIRRDGSDGGHNGIKNIIENLKSTFIKRVRIGISKNPIPLEDYVLQKFKNDELKKINDLLPTISNIIDDFCFLNIDDLMQKYNRNNHE
jgi:PTH1 family peptidyl-tRNA hydrolase